MRETIGEKRKTREKKGKLGKTGKNMGKHSKNGGNIGKWETRRKIGKKKTLRSVHFVDVVVELIKCKCGGIVRNEIW